MASGARSLVEQGPQAIGGRSELARGVPALFKQCPPACNLCIAGETRRAPATNQRDNQGESAKGRAKPCAHDPSPLSGSGLKGRRNKLRRIVTKFRWRATQKAAYPRE